MQTFPSRRKVVKSLSLGALAGLAGSIATTAAAAEPGVLRVVFPTKETTYQLPYLIAKDTGWFKERNLEVTELFVNGDATALRTVLSQGADLTLVGPPTIFQAKSRGAKLRYIGSTQPRVDYQILGSPGINRVEELADKTFASAAPSDMTTEIPRLVIKKHGGDSSKTRFLQIGGHAARLQALEAGKVDGAMVNTLTSVIGQRGGKVKVLSKVAEEYPDIGYVMYTGLGETLDNEKLAASIRTFIAGNIHGARYIEKDPEAAARILAKRVPDLNVETLLPVIKELNANKVWGTNGGLDESMVAFTSDILLRWQMISDPVSVSDIVDDRFVRAALKEMGRV